MTEEHDGLVVDGMSVDFAFGGRWRTVVDRIDLAIAPGETVGLVGESGSGKSVTSLAIMGLLPHRSARVRANRLSFQGIALNSIAERDLENVRGRHIAMIFQEPMTSLNPSFSIGEQIAESLRRHLGLDRRSANNRAVSLLEKVGIPGAARRARAYPHELSGGMRQRVMIAIALSCDPGLLIADEPTTALDVTIQAQMLELIRSVTEERKMSVLFISHDLAVIADIAERVVVMYRGEVVEDADAIELFESPRHPYSMTLLDRSVPDDDDVAGPAALGTLRSDSCRYLDRCAYAAAECHAPVGLVDLGGRLVRCRRSDSLVEVGRD